MKTQKSRYFLRVLLLCCVAISVCICVAPLHAFADNKTYNTDSADFDISFSDTGDATITETWNVTYTSGSFTRFYKDFFVPGNQLEYFPEINVLSCHINGTEATATDSLDRIDYHYFFEKTDSQHYTIHWFKAARNETVTYDITYQIPNAVKLNENNEAEFCYRLIGVNFPTVVDEVTTRVHLPDSDAVNQSSLSYGVFEADGDTLSCKISNVMGMYKMRLNMKAEYFGSLQRIISVEVPQDFAENESVQSHSGSSNRTYSSRKKSGPYSSVIAILMMPFSILIISSIVSLANKFKAKKMIKNNPNCFIESADRIQRSGIPYLWFGFNLVGVQTNERYLFYAEIIDLCHKGYLTITHDGIRFNQFDDRNVWDSLQRDMDQSFINL